jgi:hypothetical protein
VSFSTAFHLDVPLGFMDVVAAVVEDLLRRPLNIGFGLDHRHAAALEDYRRRLQGRPLLPRCGARGSGPSLCCQLLGASFHV